MATKLRCLLLDDELPGLAYLKMLAQQLPELEVVKAFDDPTKLLAEMPSIDFDLLISDIEMPGTDGLSVAQQLQNKLVIFTTAYKEYAVDAFDINAVDYLTKPIKLERLQQAVSKALLRFNESVVGKKFASFNTDKGKSILYFDEVTLIKTATNDSRDKEVVITDGKVILLKNIKFDQLQAELPVADFCRINKAEIVAIKSVAFFAHNEITLRQKDISGKQITLSLSETYRAEFVQKIKK